MDYDRSSVSNIYLGSVEIKRIYNGSTLILNRSDLHVMDDKSRIAIVNRWTTDNQQREINSSGELNQNKFRYQYGNHLGSASLELDKNAQIISYEEYFPYGGTSFVAGQNQKEVKLKEYRYTGKERDGFTSLYYYGARYYASWMGRWLSADPSVHDGINLYIYVRNNPVKRVDPDGKEQKDVIYHILEKEKPYDVAQWWGNDPRKNKSEWSHELSEWEQGYIDAFRDPSVPEILQMRAPVNPKKLTGEELEQANSIFGSNAESAEKYANYENRRRIVAHYTLTHPATIRLQMGLYRLIRDVNPIHFALERGWQIGRGKEMFTKQNVSRLGAAGEFFLAVAASYVLGIGLKKLRPNPITTSNGEVFYRTMSQTDFEEFAITGKIPATSETFISPTQNFSEGYQGILVRFNVRSGTTNQLLKIGVRDQSNITKLYHPDMPEVSKGWTSKNAYFKGEGAQINIGLGKGDALRIFNENIQSIEVVRK